MPILARVSRVDRKYVATLAVAAGLVLAVGALVRPRVPLPEQPQPSDTDLARLERLTERRALESAAAFLTRLADDVAPALVWIDAPGVTGVAWAGQVVATPPFEPTSTPVAVTSALGANAAAAGDLPADAPVGTVVIESPAPPAPVRASRPSGPGAPVIAVWRSSDGRAFAPASFIDEAGVICGEYPGREVRLTPPLTRAMAGGGVFDLDGALLGVILPCGDRMAAVIPATVDEWIRINATVDRRIRARYGMAIDSLTSREAAHFGVASGALVRELLVGGAAEGAGLRPGDLIVGVDGVPVSTPDDLAPLAATAVSPKVTLTVRRGVASLELPLDSAAPPVDAIVWESSSRGLRLEAVPPSSPLARAGLRGGDRVLRAGDGERQTPTQIRRAIETKGPAVFIEYERAGRRRAALLLRGDR